MIEIENVDAWFGHSTIPYIVSETTKFRGWS